MVSGSQRATGWGWRLLGRLGTDVRAEETRLAFSLFTYCLLLGAFQFAAKSVRQATFVDSLGFARLPFVYLGVALCAYPVLHAYSRLTRRVPLERIIRVSTLTVVVSLGLFWWLYAYAWPWVRFVFYIWISIVTLLLFSQFWSWAGAVLHPRQARRLFAFVLSGGLIGGVLGGQIAAAASWISETRAALLGAAVLLGATLPLLRSILRQRVVTAQERVAPRLATVADSAGALEEIRRSPHLRAVAGLMFVAIMVAQVTDLQFNWVIERAAEGLDQRTLLFGNFFSLMALVAFLLQVAVTARIHRSLGVGSALRVLPTVVAAGNALLLASAIFAPAGLIYVVAGLKISEGSLRYSLDQGTRELLYVPVAEHIRPRVKAYIDVLVQRIARAVAAVALLSVTFGWLSPVDVSWGVLGLVLIWLALTVLTRRHYVATFREGLLARRIDPEEPLDRSDVTTLEVLVASLGSKDARQVLHALELLESQNRAHLVPPILALHEDGAVCRRTLEILRRLERRDAKNLVERLLSDEDPEVRVEAVRTFAALSGTDASSIMLPRLRDPDPRIRTAAIVGLVQPGSAASGSEASDELASGLARTALEDMLQDEDPRVRAEAARALAGLDGAYFHNRLVRLLSDPDLEVVRAAVASVRQRTEREGVDFVFAPILISLLRQRAVKHEAREALVACGASIIPLLHHFMVDRREHRWVRRALPETVGRLGGPAARDALLDSLDSDDSFLQHKIIEALVAMRSRQPYLSFDATLIDEHVHNEARRYLRSFARLVSISEPRDLRIHGIRVEWRASRPPSLLQELLMDRMTDHAENLLGLLSLMHRQREMKLAFRQLESSDSRLRSHALEYLDNTLRPSVRRQVLAVIDDLPFRERLEAAMSLFHVHAGAPTDVARNLLQGAEDADEVGVWLGAAALSFIGEAKLRSLMPLVERIARESSEPLLRETARWVLARWPERTSVVDGAPPPPV